jgi:phosphotriesterase-related protein
MATVQTVRGPVEAAAPGRVLMHEHVFVLGTEIRHNSPDAWSITTMVVDNPRYYFGG